MPVVRLRSDRYYVSYIRCSLFRVASGVVGFQTSIETYVPVWAWHVRRLIPDFIFFMFLLTEA